jgi:hypothetical protein
MRVGFDLDKVFIDFPPFVPDRLIEKLYRKKANGELSYRIPSRPEQFIRHVSHAPILRPAIVKNIDLLKSIPKDKHKLYLISSRFGFLEGRTKALVKMHRFDEIFDEMFFNFSNKQPHEFKDEVLKKLHLDVYIDDDFHLLKHVAKHNKNTLFYWLANGGKKRQITRNIYSTSDLSDIVTSLKA